MVAVLFVTLCAEGCVHRAVGDLCLCGLQNPAVTVAWSVANYCLQDTVVALLVVKCVYIGCCTVITVL